MKLINIGSSGRTVYKFLREDKDLIIEEENNFFPYYYEPEQYEPTHYTFTKEPVKICYSSSDKEVYQSKSNQAYEADVKLDVRYLIDKVHNIEKSNIKWAMLDIEIQTKSDAKMVNPFTTDRPISCITIYNNFSKEYKQWYLPDFESEEAMLKIFTWYLANEKFDILCLDPETIINTSNGTKKLKNIKIKDSLLSLNSKGKYTVGNVISKWETEKKGKFIKSRFAEIKCSDSHSFPVLFNNGNLTYKNSSHQKLLTASEIKKGDYLLCPINYLKDSLQRDDYYWFLGYYYADGNKGKTNRLEVKDASFPLINELKKVLEKYNIKSLINKCDNHYILYSSDEKAKEFKRKIDQAKTNWISFLNQLTTEQQLSFIAGLVDGDGCFQNGHLSLSLIDKHILEWVQYILWGVGIPNYLNNGYLTKKSKNKIYQLSIYTSINNYKLKMKHLKKAQFSLKSQLHSLDMIPLQDIFIKLVMLHHPKIESKIYHALYSSRNNSISRNIANTILNECLDLNLTFAQKNVIKKLKTFIGGFCFNKVKYIKDLPKQKFIDITLDKHHLFVGNNVLTHNCGWNMNAFDYPLLQNKIEKFPDKISPVGKSRYGGRIDEDRLYFPIGTSIVDYMEWDKKYTLNRRVSYALDAVLEDEFGKGKEIKDTDFSIISEEVKQRNLNDVKDMVKLEEKNHLIDYYDNIRRMTFTQWEDLVFNTRVVDTLILKEAKERNVVLPSKPSKIIEDDFKSKVLREAFELGEFHNAISVDLSQAYPATIIDFNLDHDNIVNGITPTSLELAGSHFEQKEDGIIPTVAKKLIKMKKEVADKRDSYPVSSLEYKQWQITYKSIKGVVNTIYGYLSDRRTRMYNKDIARAITRLPKEMLLYCVEQLEKLNISAIYADTDGLILNTEENIADMLNAFLKKWAKDKYGKEITTIFDYEGIYTDLLILGKCRYHGYLKHANGEIEEKKIGIEAKRKDSSKFIKKFQKDLIEKVHKGISKEDAIKLVAEQKIYIKTLPIEDIAFPSKISKPVAEYESNSVWVRAYKYANEQYKYKVRIGQPYYYIYVESEEYEDKYIEQGMIGDIKLTKSKLKPYWVEYFKEEILVKDMKKEKVEELTHHLEEKKIITYKTIKTKGKLKDVMAFDDKHKGHMKSYKVNWHKMIERNIDNKANVIFEALKWLDTKD